MLKKTVVMVIALSIVLLALAALPGCGGDTGTARNYMNQADQAYADAMTKGLELQKQQEATLPAVVSGDPNQLKAASAQLPDIDRALAAYQDAAKATLADYRKINTLNGVAEYKTYAKMMDTSLVELITSIDTGKSLISVFTDLTNQLNAGQQADISGAKLHLFDKINQALNQSAKAKKLQEKAKDYQTNHRLAG